MRESLSLSLALAVFSFGSLIPASSGYALGKISRSGSFTPSGTKNVIAQMFQWPWDSLAGECQTNLGPAGYGYVQTSPAHEHILGPQWYTDYQVVSYNITSKRGNRTQFINMVNACKAAGVGVIVDVILNHATIDAGNAVQIGIGGNSYSKYNYPAIPYTPSNFHYCSGNGSAEDITNYHNRTNAQFCEEGSLADLAQEQAHVRTTLSNYLVDLQSMGVAGFRVDSAVQQPASNLTAIFGSLPGNWWATFEVDSDSADAIQQNEYWGLGQTMLFQGSRQLLSHFTSGGIANLVTSTPLGPSWGSPAFPPANFANFFVTNHDMERYGGSLTATSPNNTYILAHLFILAFGYGTPEVFSGYEFTDASAGAPQDSNGLTLPVDCFSNGWRCEHRFPAISNMVGFHNAVGNSSLLSAQVGTSQQIAFGRGNIGFIAINNDATAWTTTFQTGLPAGKYCDVIHDTFNNAACGMTPVAVDSSGTVSITVAPHDAIAFYGSPNLR